MTGTGQQVEGGRQPVGELDRRLGLPPSGQRTQHPHALDRVLDVAGGGEAGGREPVADEVVDVTRRLIGMVMRICSRFEAWWVW